MGRQRLVGGWNPRVDRRGLRLGPGVVIGGLLLIGVVVGITHNRLRAKGSADPLLGGVQAVTRPAQTTAAKVSQGANATWNGLFGGVALERENERLKAELSTAHLETETLRRQEAENVRLRSLLGFVEKAPVRPLIADVIAWVPSELEQTITLARGSRGGVHPGMAVRTGEGLVGKVIDAGPVTAKVRLLTDPDSGVGVQIVGTSAFGILKGVEEVEGAQMRRHVLEVIHLDRALDIKVGAEVRTSGHGGVFPPDIPVGKIESVREDSTHLLKIARVIPYAEQPGGIRQVLVLPLQTISEPKPGAARVAEREHR